MEKEFVHYEQALALKELGFDEDCIAFGYICGKEQLYIFMISTITNKNSSWVTDLSKTYISIPTYSQAFRWFREKINLHSYIEGAYPWYRYYINSEDDRWEGCKYLLFKEAELECLKKLIGIVKNKIKNAKYSNNL